MWCNQIFSLISENKIQNIVVCDDYEVANQLARATYGEEAIAVDTTDYPVHIDDSYIEGVFYREEEVIQKNPSTAEQITALQDSFNELDITQAEAELDVDARLCNIELGLI